MDENARYMVAIADAGSISEAARRTHVSQPALSQRLRNLERSLGCELFDRRTSPLAPTYAGSIYLDWARDALTGQDAMERQLADIASGTRRRLAIGTSLPRGNGMLPEVIEAFYREVSGCVVFLFEAGMPQSHERLLMTRQIDCALLTPVRPEPPIVTGEPLARERMLLITPPDMAYGCEAALAATPGSDGHYPVVEPRDLEGVPFIMPPAWLKHSTVVREMMDEAGVRVSVAFHSSGNEMSLEMVRRGLGVTICPNTFACGTLAEGLGRYELAGVGTRGELYYNRRAGTVPTGDERVFVNLLRTWLSKRPEFA